MYGKPALKQSRKQHTTINNKSNFPVVRTKAAQMHW